MYINIFQVEDGCAFLLAVSLSLGAPVVKYMDISVSFSMSISGDTVDETVSKLSVDMKEMVYLLGEIYIWSSFKMKQKP